MIFELCCGSTADAVAAYEGGSPRVELNSDLFHGGLTPSIGEVRVLKKICPKLKLMCMVRPREGGFDYTDIEFETMKEDAKALIESGADGIVFGFLNSDGTVNKARCKEMMEIIGNKESVFHRAIDVTPNWKEAMDILIELGVTRILTSGQKPTVPEGVFTIKEMIDYAAGRIEIQPGGGITPENAAWVKEMTGAKMMHAAVLRTAFDHSTSANPAITYGGCFYPPEDRYSVSHKDDVADFIKRL